MLTTSDIVKISWDRELARLRQEGGPYVARLSRARLVLGDRKTCVGMAYATGKVELSRYFIDTGMDMTPVIIHELAHLAVGVEKHHCKEWKRLCVGWGGDGARCCSIPSDCEGLLKYKWSLECTKCPETRGQHRRSKGPLPLCHLCGGPCIWKHQEFPCVIV